MGKNPGFLFYPNDWLNDNELQRASFSTIGIWINLLCRMWWSTPRGTLTGASEDLRRLAGCDSVEWTRFLEEADRLRFADVIVSDMQNRASVQNPPDMQNRASCTDATHVTLGNKIVTVINRRMVRDEKSRESTRNRVRRHRHGQSNTNVTVPLPVPVPVPVPVTVPENGKDVGAEPAGAPAAPGIPENLRGWLLGSQHLTVLADAKHAAFWRALESAYDAYAWLYFEEEIRKADAWIAANPRRKPTPRGLPRFMRNWFERAVEIGRRRQHA